MIISLLHFDSEIDPQIVSRGRSYYRKGAVIELEQDGENWHAVVAGSDEYTVDVLVNNGKIIRCNCTCPYDFGSFCKHEVAVFFSIRDGIKTVKIRKAKMTTLVTPQTNAQITHLLQSLPQNDLVDFIADLSEQSATIKRQVLLRFNQKKSDKSTLARLIKHALRQASDRHGFLDYWSTGRATENVWEYLDEAEQLVKQQNYSATIPYYQAMIEVVVPALQQADDSNGELGGLIEIGFEKLSETAPKLHQDDQKQLFSYCLNESKSAKYDGWSDWQLQWLQIAALLITSPNQQMQLFETIDELKTKDDRGKRSELLDENFESTQKTPILVELDSYFAQRAALLKHQVITKIQGKDAGFNFLLEKQAMPDIKKVTGTPKTRQTVFHSSH